MRSARAPASCRTVAPRRPRFAQSSERHKQASTKTQSSMDLLNAVWRFSVGGDKDLAAGQQALERIQQLLVTAIAKYDGEPHALTREEIAPSRPSATSSSQPIVRCYRANTLGWTGRNLTALWVLQSSSRCQDPTTTARRSAPSTCTTSTSMRTRRSPSGTGLKLECRIDIEPALTLVFSAAGSSSCRRARRSLCTTTRA